jgi:uncharacterized protein (DUF433 family)
MERGRRSIMQLEDYFEFLAPGEIKIKGHRIWIEHVLDEYIHHGLSLEELVKRFDTLTREQILAVLLYYHHNKEAMDTYLAHWLDYCRTSREQNMRENAAWYERMRRLKTEKSGLVQPRATVGEPGALGP